MEYMYVLKGIALLGALIMGTSFGRKFKDLADFNGHLDTFNGN